MLKFLTDAVEKNASDIFIIPGLPLSYKIMVRLFQSTIIN